MGWWVLLNFPNFPLSDHGVHLKSLVLYIIIIMMYSTNFLISSGLHRFTVYYSDILTSYSFNTQLQRINWLLNYELSSCDANEYCIVNMFYALLLTTLSIQYVRCITMWHWCWYLKCTLWCLILASNITTWKL